MKTKGSKHSSGLVKRITGWFSVARKPQDNRIEFLEVVQQLQKVQDVDPDASAAVNELADKIIGEQQVDPPENEADNSLAGATEAWQESKVAHAQAAEKYRTTGSGR